MTEALHRCTRIIVHSLADIERLREFGVSGNVVLFPHGIIDRPALNADAVRALLGLSGSSPIIGSFGFLLPGKGLTELIHSFALITRACPNAYLLMVNAEFPTPKSREQSERCLQLVRLLELESQVRLINDFLDIDETLLVLSACDAIVYAYQRTEESASGAVRLGLAAGRPVFTTPLPIFADLSGVVHQLPGTDPSAIAEGVLSVLCDEDCKAEIQQRQREFVRANSWATQAARLSNIILGCFEEARGVELRVPTALAPIPGRGGLWREDDLAVAQQFRNSMRASASDGLAPGEASAEIDDLVSATRARKRLGLLRRLRAKPARTAAAPPRQASIKRADRARDARDWPAAVRYYREALDHNPNNPPIWVQYGHALKELGNPAEAENAYRELLELDGEVADTHLQLGHVLKIQGRKIEASVAYLRALMLDPAFEDAAAELRALGWTTGRIWLALRRERGANR